MSRRLLSLLLAVVAALGTTALLGTATASAAPYPPSTGAALSVSAFDPCAGASNIIGGTGFQPGETVSVVLAQTGEIARVTVRADGSFQTTVTIPLSSRGSDRITATGLSSGLVATLTLDVPCVVGQDDGDGGSAGHGSGSLASTGAAVGGIALLGLVLVGAGTTTVLASRRRRAATNGG